MGCVKSGILLRFRMPLKCQNRLFERQSTPGYFKCKRQIGFYFPKTDDFRAVSENKNRFENGFEHPGGVLIFKCVSNRECEISVLFNYFFNFICALIGNTAVIIDQFKLKCNEISSTI